MLGQSLKLSVLSDTLGQNNATFYYPAETWCNVFNTTDRCFVSPGQSLNQRTLPFDFYLYLRGGNVIPIQNATANVTNTTAQLQNLPVDFHVSPKTVGATTAWTSTGVYYNDDGVKLDLNGNGNSYRVDVAGDNATAAFTVTITTLVNATNYLNKGGNTGNCSAVN